MSRLPAIDVTQLTPEQAAVFESIRSGPRGQVRGPFLALLHAPDIASSIQSLGARLRFSGQIPAGQREVVILVVANFWKCNYEWVIHEADARKAGVQEAMLDAVRRGVPLGTNTPEGLVHDFTLELLTTGTVGQELYALALDCLKPAGLVEVNVLIGYYTMLALVLNANEVQPPAL